LSAMDDEPGATPPPDPAPEGEAPPQQPAADRRTSAGSIVRGVVLGVIAFVATLVLVFGLGSFVVSSPVGSSAPSSVIGPGAPSSVIGSLPAASPGPTPSATPAPSDAGFSAGSDPVLVGAGDIADCDLPADGATADLVARIAGTVFTAGDNVYPSGSAGEFRDCYGPTWGRFLDRTNPAPGNHDHNTGELAGYHAYFGWAAAPNGTSWYSYDLGAWHVIVLDSSCDAVGGCRADSDQGRWLAADLAASTARCTLAIWHHPRWSSGEHGNDAAVVPFWRALYDAGADVVVNGHDHDYERFAPQDPNGREDQARGLREFVVGTGGAALRGFPSTAANSIVRSSLAHGIIRFDLHAAGYEWRFISTTGESSDAGSGSCH